MQLLGRKQPFAQLTHSSAHSAVIIRQVLQVRSGRESDDKCTSIYVMYMRKGQTGVNREAAASLTSPNVGSTDLCG